MLSSVVRLLGCVVVLVLVLLSNVEVVAAAAAPTAATEEWIPGLAASQPVALGKHNFEDALADPANPFWLLKFYAPWCGHCKRLAPILETVASQTRGKMSIGKIDCTAEGKLCDRYNIGSYPTLKFSMDGDITKLHDYPGGRKEQDFLAFGRKMTRPAIQQVSSISAALEFLNHQSESGVVFLAFEPTTDSSMENQQDTSVTADHSQSTSSTLFQRVLQQVARKNLPVADVLLLVPNENTNQQDSQLPPPWNSPLLTSFHSHYFCRLESNVPVRCFSRITTDNEAPTTTVIMDPTDLGQFLTDNYIPTVSQLGPNNFKSLTRQGRPLVIGVVPVSDHNNKKLVVDDMTQALVALATTEPFQSQYYFSWMDGNLFHRFLEQFKIDKDKDLPSVFVLDQGKQVFWQNSTHFHWPETATTSQQQYYSSNNLELLTRQFLHQIADGTLKSQVTEGGGTGMKRVLNDLSHAIMQNRPWSFVVIVLVLLVLALAVSAIIVGDDDDVPPPRPPPRQHRPQRTTGSENKKNEPSIAIKVKEDDGDGQIPPTTVSENEESKKDK